MKVRDYIKEKLLFVLATVLVAGFVAVMLSALGMSGFSIGFITAVYLLAAFLVLLIEYLRKSSFYRSMLKQLDSLDQKYLLAEMVETPDFLEGRIFAQVLQACNKSMNDRISKYSIASNEYQEYIETWVHEIKTPIATGKLLAENNDTPVTESIEEELERIEGFVEQVLYYSRSNNVEKDYNIREIMLGEVVRAALKKNAKNMISAGMRVETKKLEIPVFTDSKWMEFILGQVFTNSVKYRKTEGYILIYAEKAENQTLLYIEDDGIGVPQKDVGRVFQKGFTGENGHKYTKSTGMGLYLCQKLCRKLSLTIAFASEQGKGSRVCITFPHNTYVQLD